MKFTAAVISAFLLLSAPAVAQDEPLVEVLPDCDGQVWYDEPSDTFSCIDIGVPVSLAATPVSATPTFTG